MFDFSLNKEFHFILILFILIVLFYFLCAELINWM